MSVLVEIAEKADVSVEGVVRVLTREPVSDAVQERVLAVLEDLNPEQTRAVQRFALAALHDVLPRPVEARDAFDEVPPAEPLPQPPTSSAAVSDQLPAPRQDAALVELSSVLGELAEAVRDLRRETDAERRERVDDLAVLIDLITTGWQGLDGRLGRLERQLSRLESGRPQPAAARPVLVEPVRVEPVRVEPLPVEPPPVEPLPAETPRAPAAPIVASSTTVFDSDKRDRLPLAAAVTMVGVVIGTLAVLQLFSAGPDVTGLVSARDTPSEAADGTVATTRAAAPTGAVTTGAATTPRPRATTSSVLGTTVGKTRPKPTAKPKPVPAPAPAATAGPVTTGSATTGPATTRPATTRPATTRPATTRPATTAPSPAGFLPTRNWAWGPVEGADYYDVEFRRDGESFYRATPTDAKLTLPSSVFFLPGSYRWVVRPGFGERSVRNLGATVVDSPFTVTR